jgi:hypothetical protein
VVEVELDRLERNERRHYAIQLDQRQTHVRGIHSVSSVPLLCAPQCRRAHARHARQATETGARQSARPARSVAARRAGRRRHVGARRVACARDAEADCHSRADLHPTCFQDTLIRHLPHRRFAARRAHPATLPPCCASPRSPRRCGPRSSGPASSFSSCSTSRFASTTFSSRPPFSAAPRFRRRRPLAGRAADDALQFDLDDPTSLGAAVAVAAGARVDPAPRQRAGERCRRGRQRQTSARIGRQTRRAHVNYV